MTAKEFREHYIPRSGELDMMFTCEQAEELMTKFAEHLALEESSLDEGEWKGLPCPHDSAECNTIDGVNKYTCSDCGASLEQTASPEPLLTQIVCKEYCGSLDWTIEKYGRITHKHGCPNRTDKFCQTHPKDCQDSSAIQNLEESLKAAMRDALYRVYPTHTVSVAHVVVEMRQWLQELVGDKEKP
jgi:DNA-directed RNA polymerase subunit RPC12/RpoP